MHRRSFLLRCGLAVGGTVFLPGLVPCAIKLRAAEVSAQLTASDHALLRMLAAYGTDSYFWGNGVLARATGVQSSGKTNLLVLVPDYGKLTVFLRSRMMLKLGKIQAQGNTLSFNFQGTAYTVTNEGTEGFNRAVAGGGVTRGRAVGAGLGTFTHQTLLYHPATNTLSDPGFVLTTHRVELASLPTGGIKARVQTLADGWMEARQHGLKLGKNFTAFQDELLSAEPTEKAAPNVVKTLLANISELAGMFSVDDLRPLLLSPLVSTSLQEVLGIDAQQIVADVETLRAKISTDDYSDAAIWLATLLSTQIKTDTAGEWLDLTTDDEAANMATRAAISRAKRLMASSVIDDR